MRVDALIVGGGPAGSSCAVWLHQLGFRVTLIEREPQLGGLQRSSPYPNRWMPGVMEKTGVEFARDLDSQVRSIGVPVLRESEARSVTRHGDRWQIEIDASTVIDTEHLVIATGVEARTGGIEAGSGIIVGPGAPVEQFDFTGKQVAILGGGDNAAENYAIIGAKSPARLLLFARHVRARPELFERVPEAARRIGAYTVDGPRRSVTQAGKEETFDALVVLYGWQARIPAPIRGLEAGLVDDRGFIATDRERRTRVPGLWAIGEVTQQAHPCVVTAMSDGVVCAKAIESCLR